MQKGWSTVIRKTVSLVRNPRILILDCSLDVLSERRSVDLVQTLILNCFLASCFNVQKFGWAILWSVSFNRNLQVWFLEYCYNVVMNVDQSVYCIFFILLQRPGTTIYSQRFSMAGCHRNSSTHHQLLSRNSAAGSGEIDSWAYIIGQDPSVSKTNRLHVVIFRFSLVLIWDTFYRFL